MPLVSPKEMFKKAYGKYAIGAFNVNNMEILQGVIEAAKEERAPVILQISAGARKYAKQIYLIKLIEAALEDAPDIPIAVHLDHGDSFELCKAVIDAGFNSVMIDGSHLPFEENVKLTRQVVEYAHPRGVVVEGELGRLVGVEEHVVVDEREAVFTDPDKAVEFVERTGVDSLAISIGTSHGAYKFKGEPRLDFERLQEIAKRLPGFPLVLHGASSVLQDLVEKANKYGAKIVGAQGVPEEMIRKATIMGICKVNIDTDLRLAFTATIREVLATKPEEFDPRKYLGPAREAIKEVVKHKMRNVLGCSGQA
ncbi:class II fructose-1,6-bisphosphate aldolase [Pseudothermotoga thermarum]|uniref:fructose-bisphosphate aldolase n=1 Tax=Pseudothermotoga thermarum DSM 5069 TaxID=688269 RepID=F7YU41_9THEM|nr:class II fructose-1,6-bisphosphate aldolase [Pseudothermotoga thermarum]AEH50137.1 fructose-bisphosphate aldolase [Pseudothermotoga thermarum DSM 5069]